MNRTLLLILCDFLLLNLLALTRWEQAEPPPVSKPPVASATTGSAGTTPGQDLVETMKLSLVDERRSREELAQKLERKEGELEVREKNVASLLSEKTQLATSLASTQQTAEQLARQATVTKERLAQMQRELEEKRRLADQQEQQLQTLEKQQTEARQRIEGLSVAVQEAEQDQQLLRENAVDWETMTATFTKESLRASPPRIEFSAIDPRIVFLPVSEDQVRALGAKVYQTALDPFRFPEAVLISNGGAGYGEVPFKLDPTNANFVRMDNRLVRRLFGDFSPSRGDLVLSKSGELLGIMVNSEYCAVINHFQPAVTMPIGTIPADAPTGPKIEELNRRWRALPVRVK